ncbi:thioredoxin family protein [Nonomuraea sp. JJY05]|uniref:thioredoxin family protein n=1 Tax=Nonomuraea sp. JJY05 TaxID=3350255 RepID=UPI00373F110D
MTGWWVALATLALGSVIGVVRLRRDGRVRDTGGERLSEADLGAGLGERATLVQFSTAFCQPCRATRRILADVSGIVPGVTHVEIDAESRLDLVRRLDIMRTPTVLVLDTSGKIVKRAAGLPRKADVLAALATAVSPLSSHESSHQPDEM